MLRQLDTENADRNLTSLITVLTHTPNASAPMDCKGIIYFGDGTKNLDASGGDFELVITVGGQTVEPSPQVVVFSLTARCYVTTVAFPVPANDEVIMRVKSPNAADTDVDVTAYLYDATSADVVSISQDSTAADNLESQYDETGLAGGAFPATQEQVGNIGAGGSGAINRSMTTDNVSSALKGISFVGVQTSGTFATTQGDPSSYHQIDDVANNIDIVYKTNVGGLFEATSILFDGYLSGVNDEVVIQAYDFVGSQWDTRLVLSGQAGSTNVQESIPLLQKHTGVDAENGDVYIRFTCTAQSNPTLFVGTLFAQAVNVAQSVGYSDGAIWFDSNASNTNTVVGVDGVADNPVSTWAAILSLSSSLGITRFHIINGSTITLSANSDNYTLLGAAWSLVLNGQSIAGMAVFGAAVTGIGTGATAPQFIDCHLSTVTLPPSHLTRCGLSGTFTIGSVGDFFFDVCHSMVAGISTPGLDFGSGLNASNVNFRGYQGGIEIQNMGDGTGSYNMSLEGNGQLIINANCSATSTVAIRGNFTVTDNASGAVTLSDDARYDVDQINAEVDTALVDYGGSTHSAADVWTSATRTLTSFAAVAASIWDYLTSAAITVGSMGKLIVDNLDAKISSVGGVLPGGVTITEDTLDTSGAALGKVEGSGSPIAGASVNVYAVADTDLLTILYSGITDGDGGFSIQVVSGATYIIDVVATGFTFVEKEVTV